LFILENLENPQDALIFAQRLFSLVRVSRRRLDQEYAVSLSIGICIFPLDNHDVPAILKNADQALYRAKTQGTNNVSMF
jgi:diguanylate cyclase (GGDEF)-like protein